MNVKRWNWIQVGGVGVAGVLLLGLWWQGVINVKTLQDKALALVGWESAEKNQATANADEHAHDHADEGEHVDISAVAAKSIGLELQIVRTTPYTQYVHIPASVVEKPGQSGLAISSPIQGVVSKIHCFPGQAIGTGDLLFTMQVTDEALETAQLSLLETISRLTVTEREIERLDPLAESGAVVGRRRLEMEYQLKTLQSEQAARLQELRLRGLSPQQIDRITNERELVSEIEIRLELSNPEEVAAGATPPISDPLVHTVEELNVYPGKSVRKGEELCHVANHQELYVRGEAFEPDVAAIHHAMQKQWGISVETGEDDAAVRLDGLAVTYLDNHVDERSQTYPFYLAVPNRVISQQVDAAGRLFRSWQYKPGQRAHVYVPQQTWPDQCVLPRGSLVTAGVNHYVFRLHETLDDVAFERNSEERLQRTSTLEEWVLEPVPVHVLHQDRTVVVIDKNTALNDEPLQDGDIVVTRGAYQAYLAWKLQSSEGGGGHDHGHAH